MKSMRRSATADNFTTNRLSNMGDIKEIRCFNENPRDESWTRHERHFFIITDASRPVYCRYGNELNVTPLLCTIVAFTGQLIRDGNQKLKTIVAGNKLFVFYLPNPFIFVCVSSVKLPVSLLMKELQVLEQIIFSILTPNITLTLQRRPNFDIKKQTSGSESHFTAALELMDNAHTFIFNDCIPMAAVSHCRDKYKKVVHKNFNDSVFACVVFYQSELFFYVEKSSFKITPDDITVLLNDAYPKERGDELTKWAPLCLPERPDMFHNLTVEIMDNLMMILIADQIDASLPLTKMYESILAEYNQRSNEIEKPEPIEPIENPDILHFIIASHSLKQVYSPFLISTDMSKVIYRSYAWAYEYLKTSQINGPFYLATDELTMFGIHNSDKTLIGATHVGCPAEQTQKMLEDLLRYVNDNEEIIFDFSPLKWQE